MTLILESPVLDAIPTQATHGNPTEIIPPTQSIPETTTTPTAVRLSAPELSSLLTPADLLDPLSASQVKSARIDLRQTVALYLRDQHGKMHVIYPNCQFARSRSSISLLRLVEEVNSTLLEKFVGCGTRRQIGLWWMTPNWFIKTDPHGDESTWRTPLECLRQSKFCLGDPQRELPDPIDLLRNAAGGLIVG